MSHCSVWKPRSRKSACSHGHRPRWSRNVDLEEHLMSPSSPQLYTRVLSNASMTESLPAIDDETQDLLSKSLNDLRTLHSRVLELSIFSPNETVDDISTRDLAYLTVPYVFAGIQNRIRTAEPEDRLDSLTQIQNYLQNFMNLLETYNIVSEDEKKLYKKKPSTVSDPAKKRELKISQFRREKVLKDRVESLRKRIDKNAVLENSVSDYDLIASLLPVSSIPSEREGELDSETDEILRDTTLILLRMFYARAASQLQNAEQEQELLQNVPPSNQTRSIGGLEDIRNKRRREEDNAWKLDRPLERGLDGRGPILDASGRPLRTFTILPSDAAERARLQANVFGPGYNLPTMTIDEYLEVERQRGKIITNGGPASQNAPTTSEQLAVDSEMDGTLQGELKAEKKRQKDEKWGRYTDDHPRGTGNRMNRG